MNAQFTQEPLTQHTGTLITGVDLVSADDATFEQIYQLWIERCVIALRDQQITDDELVALGNRFGQVELVPFYDAKPFWPEVPDELQVVTNVGANGEPVGGLANYEATWHSDQSYRDPPPSLSLLYAHEIPSRGGDTWFLNTYRAYETLPDELRRAAEQLVIEHDGSTNTAGKPRATAGGGHDKARHRAVLTHPETGRRALYLGRRVGAAVVEGDPDVLDALWDHIIQDGAVYAHRWRPRDLVIWDNRCTLHRRDEFPATERRVLRRLQTAGTPVSA